MKRNIVIATLTAAALATGGTVAAFAAGDDDGTATQRRTSTGAQVVSERDDDVDRTAVGDGKVTAAEAIAAALKHTPGTVVSADLDDAGTWDVDVVKSDGAEYSVDVSSDTGKVLGAHRDDDDDDRDELAALKGTSVDAREAALAAAAKGTVTEAGVDDDGAVAWDVETTKGEWKVDLQTGKVSQDRDDRDDHDNDGDDD